MLLESSWSNCLDDSMCTGFDMLDGLMCEWFRCVLEKIVTVGLFCLPGNSF